MSEFIDQIYGWIDQFNLSAPVLMGISLLLVIALLYCVREVASWITKTDALRRELRTLSKSILEMQRELTEIKNRAETKPHLPPPERPLPYRDEFPLM